MIIQYIQINVHYVIVQLNIILCLKYLITYKTNPPNVPPAEREKPPGTPLKIY